MKKKKKSRERNRGIVAFAKEAGVTRTHVYRVLKGERKSPRITRLWNEFQQAQEEAK